MADHLSTLFIIAALLELKALCNVLGSNYKEKLDEIGIVNGVDITSTIRNRLLQAVLFLKITKKNRFDKNMPRSFKICGQNQKNPLLGY